MPSDDRNDLSDLILDRERCGVLMRLFNDEISAYYKASETPGKASILEVLNALACCAAMVIAATAPNGAELCLQFFTQALQEQLNHTLDLIEEHGMPTAEPSPATH